MAASPSEEASSYRLSTVWARRRHKAVDRPIRKCLAAWTKDVTTIVCPFITIQRVA
jgi:hypothetical protein